MKKLLVLFPIIFLSCFIAAVYGIIHDQFTYTISAEYYTKYKFYQFGLFDTYNPDIQNPRLWVAVIGIMATWWLGLIIGSVLGLVSLIHKSWQEMLKITLKAEIVVIGIAFITGLIGLYVGSIKIKGIDFEGGRVFRTNTIREIINNDSFDMVMSMHNFSYLGGVLGMLAGVVYIIMKKRQNRKYKTNLLKTPKS